MKNNYFAIGFCIVLAIIGLFGFIIIPNKIDNYYESSHETDPEYVRAIIYYDMYQAKNDVKIVKLSDVLKYDGGWFICDNGDGTKNYYYNCKIVIYRSQK